MRWLLIKDLQILRRSPLLVALLVLYPVVVAVLMGAALTGGPEKPRVAFANLAGDAEVSLGGRALDPAAYTERLFDAIDPIRVDTRAEAIAKVRDGEALAALVIPADAAERLQSLLSLNPGEPPTVEVFYNAEDPVKRRYVESTIRARLADADAALSDAVLAQSARYLDLVVKGGKLSFPLVGDVQILGLRNARTLIDSSLKGLPADAPQRAPLEQVSRFAKLAGDNLDLSKPILASIGEPVRIKQTVISGSRTPLDQFAVTVAATLSLMLVTLLLAAALLALEREEGTFARLVRGLVSRTALLTEKVVLAAAAALVVTLLQLGIVSLFVGLGWSASWLAALAAGALAFAALGTALGAVAREVRVATLLAILLALPLAFLALIPSGAVSAGLYDTVNVISGAFPFKPTLRALDGQELALVHLLALALAYATLARVALRRF
jgi:ABC-type transport system involved in cytochrome c biogenesis permease component